LNFKQEPEIDIFFGGPIKNLSKDFLSDLSFMINDDILNCDLSSIIGDLPSESKNGKVKNGVHKNGKVQNGVHKNGKVKNV